MSAFDKHSSLYKVQYLLQLHKTFIILTCAVKISVVSFNEKQIAFLISGLYYKSFTIVIYDCNDSTIIEPIL